MERYLDPKTNLTFKKIFGQEKNKDIVISFLNDLDLFTTKRTIKDVEFLRPVQDPEILLQKESIVDILCKDEDGTKYIVEMQVACSPYFIKIAQYYAAKVYSRQLNSGDKYDKLKEIVFLAIANFKMFPEKKAFKSDHVILDKKSYEHNLKDFYFCFIELPKFNKKSHELETMLDKWCYFLKNAPRTTKQDLEKFIGSNQVLRKAYDEMNRVNWTDDELLEYDRAEKLFTDEVNIASAVEDTKKLGRQEGRQECLKEGLKQKSIETAKNLLKMNLSLEEISKATGLSVSEVKKLNADK